MQGEPDNLNAVGGISAVKPEGPLRRLHGNRKGALFVEFIIAFIPTFILYLGVCEVSLLYVSKLRVIRAASAASRAAAVVLPDHPDAYEDDGGDKVPVNAYSGKRKEDIFAAAAIVLSPFAPWRVEVTLNDSDPDTVGHNDLLTVKVVYEHRCVMPIVRSIVCKSLFDTFGFGAYVDDTARVPNQGSFDTYYNELKQ